MRNPFYDKLRTEAKVGLLGASLGTGNRGVSALGASVVKLIKEALPAAETFLVISNRDGKPFQVSVNGKPTVVPVVHYRQSPKSKLKHQIVWIMLMSILYRCLPLNFLRRLIADSSPWIKAVAEARLVAEIRGGDSFSDIYGLKRFVVGSLPVLSVILIRGRIALLPQTYGPYKSRTARQLARIILRHSSIILSRDREGFRAVEQLIGKTDRCRYCADVAFSLEASRPESPAITLSLPTAKGGCLLGINVNGLMFNGGYTRDNMFGLKMDYSTFVIQLVKTLLEDRQLRVLLVPHTFAPAGNAESDPDACRKVIEALPADVAHRVHLVTAEYDQHEIKGVIGMCDFFIGSRMHACIAAMSQGIPTVGVAYSKKFHGVFDSVNMGEWVVDGRDVTNEQAIERTLSLFQKREEVRGGLLKKVQEVKLEHKEVFRQLMSV